MHSRPGVRIPAAPWWPSLSPVAGPLLREDLAGAETAGGLVLKELGAVLATADTMLLGGFRFRVCKVEDRRIVSLTGSCLSDPRVAGDGGL